MVGIDNSLGVQNLADYMRGLERRIARLERGTSGGPTTDTGVITSLNITGMSVTSQTVYATGDTYQVYATIGWTAIPNDPSEYNKNALDGYLTSYSTDAVHFTAELFTTDNSIRVGPFAQNVSITFRARARDITGTLGNYTSVTFTTTGDSTAPFQPATPTVAPYLGQLAIDWSGLDVSSNPMPTDFRFCEVHLSTTSATFTPSTATLVGTILRGGGTWVATDLIYGTTYFSRLVAVDTVGNRSVASTAGSGVPVQAADGDIASLGVGKLTAGVITAVMTITGRLATALTGTRVEMNSSGIQAFNSAGAQTFGADASTGAVTITGTFRNNFPSAASPYLDITNTSDRTTMTFYDSTGSNPAFQNAPIISSVPMIGLNTGQFTYLSAVSKHRLFLDSTFGMFLESFRVSGATTNAGRLALTGTGAFLQWNDSTGAPTTELVLQDSGNWFTRGSFPNNATGVPDQLAACIANNDSAGIGPGTAIVFSYGTTMADRPGVAYGLFTAATPPGHCISAFSTTSWTLKMATSITANAEYWAFRTT